MCPIMGLVPIRPFQGPHLSCSDRDSRWVYSAPRFLPTPLSAGNTRLTAADQPDLRRRSHWALGGGLDVRIAPFFA
jgi:hypothetical protein